MRTSPLFGGVNIVSTWEGNQSKVALQVLPEGPSGVAVDAADLSDADCYVPSQAADELCRRVDDMPDDMRSGDAESNNVELFELLNMEPPEPRRTLAELIARVIQDAPLAGELKKSILNGFEAHKGDVRSAGMLGPID